MSGGPGAGFLFRHGHPSHSIGGGRQTGVYNGAFSAVAHRIEERL